MRTVFTITDQPKETLQAVLQRMGLGITAWSARGVFTEREHTVLICTIKCPAVPIPRQLFAEINPRAVPVIEQGYQAIGGLIHCKSQPGIQITKEKGK